MISWRKREGTQPGSSSPSLSTSRDATASALTAKTAATDCTRTANSEKRSTSRVTVQPGPDSRVGNSLVLKSASGPTDAQIVGAQRRFSKPTGSFPPGRLRSKDGSTLRSPTRRLGVVWPRSSDIARRVLRLRGASRRKHRISLRMMGPAFLQGQPGWRA